MKEKCDTCNSELTVEHGNTCIFCLLKEEYLSMADYRKVKDRKPDEPDVFYRPPSVRL